MQELQQVTERRNEKLVRELGPLVSSCLQDHGTEDIRLNPDGQLWVKRTHEEFRIVGKMPPAQAFSAFGTIAAIRDTVINHENPILETELPLDGSRFEGLIPPVVRHPIFAIRRRPKHIFTLDQYHQSGIITDKADPLNRLRRRENFAEQLTGCSHVEVIRAAVAAKKNILTVGSTGSGKTTLTNAILDAIAGVSPDDRVISIEDT